MTPSYNHRPQQTPAPFPQSEIEKTSQPAEEKEKGEDLSFKLAKPGPVNDPAQWDEAWFSNYE